MKGDKKISLSGFIWFDPRRLSIVLQKFLLEDQIQVFLFRMLVKEIFNATYLDFQQLFQIN